MDITTNQSPAFAATKLPQPRRITQKNMDTITKVRDLVEHNKMYKEADQKKIDMYYLRPTRKNEKLRVIYYDNNMGSFVRNKNGEILETSVTSKHDISAQQLMDVADRINKTLNDITFYHRYKAPYYYYDPNRYLDEYTRICKRNYIKPEF